MNETVSIRGMAGSLRKGSYNRALLRIASELVPEDAKLEVLDLEGIPLFSQDFLWIFPYIGIQDRSARYRESHLDYPRRVSTLNVSVAISRFDFGYFRS